MQDIDQEYADAPAELREKIKGWITEHGEVAIFRTPNGLAVFNPPSQDDYESFVDRVAVDKNSKAVALRQLSQSCVLYPTLDDLRAIFKKKPALPTAIGGRLVELAGGTNAGEVAKA